MIDTLPLWFWLPASVLLWTVVLMPNTAHSTATASVHVWMSKHHRDSNHTSATYHLRPEIQARLPLPCTECGKPVYPDQKWHVAHLTPASKGGRTTRQNTGAAHAMCNLKAGGKLGAKTTNHRRRTSRGAREGIRPW